MIQTGEDISMNSRINVLWVIDHVCYDGSLHGGGRLYWNVVPKFDPRRFHIVPCFLRSSEILREVFADAQAPVRMPMELPCCRLPGMRVSCGLGGSARRNDSSGSWIWRSGAQK